MNDKIKLTHLFPEDHQFFTQEQLDDACVDLSELFNKLANRSVLLPISDANALNLTIDFGEDNDR